MGFQAMNDVIIEGVLTDNDRLQWYAKGRECELPVLMSDKAYGIVDDARTEKNKTFVKVRIHGQMADDCIYCHHIEVA